MRDLFSLSHTSVELTGKRHLPTLCRQSCQINEDRGFGVEGVRMGVNLRTQYTHYRVAQNHRMP